MNIRCVSNRNTTQDEQKQQQKAKKKINVDSNALKSFSKCVFCLIFGAASELRRRRRRPRRLHLHGLHVNYK